ncbi:hypothetical protein DICPUDRAFT_93058 [Dictyostelium purpureum]|uniref:TNFR-Cys domain-containing protein n=1 Tax=Dictyostelium purpureum TaxID=5786 RepID=F1A1E9_DICPU|nr:uncharacterized protein DICPUDRAFT_93058 [Dictyostelium purpureum]EGC29987.1 hypothetical protein DICPUDRAFT_93058 [Dictyostelium purpureum]|eukprot:XP_003293490.1 hypothetical protein DICPUDRAFT_93058 [Dictyostelium purpureum]
MNNKYFILIFLSIFLIFNFVSANTEDASFLKCDPKYCLKVKCGPKQTTCKKSACCTGCKPDCDTVKCAKVCAEDETPIIDDCSCCPSDCKKNCDNVECPLIKCAPGYISKKVGCCNTCVQNCSKLICDWPLCRDNAKPETKPGNCCPSCPN